MSPLPPCAEPSLLLQPGRPRQRIECRDHGSPATCRGPYRPPWTRVHSIDSIQHGTSLQSRHQQSGTACRGERTFQTRGDPSSARCSDAAATATESVTATTRPRVNQAAGRLWGRIALGRLQLRTVAEERSARRARPGAQRGRRRQVSEAERRTSWPASPPRREPLIVSPLS